MPLCALCVCGVELLRFAARASFLSALLLTFASASALHLSAQQLKNSRAESEQDETIRVDSDLVSLSVRVSDEQHRPVRNLRREDFRVSEDGTPQTISFFSTEESPISYGLVVCYSGVGREQFGEVIAAGKTVIEGNRPGDETFIARFMSNERAQIQWNFTSDQKALAAALDALYTGDAPRTLVDAVYLSVEHVAQSGMDDSNETRRRLRHRALVLITDGEDRHSFYKQEQLFALLRKEDVQVYVVGFVGELKGGHNFVRQQSKRAQAVTLLNRLASETGGRAFYPNSPRDLPLIAGEIARDLRTQYIIGYSPTNREHDGSFRTLNVAVADATPNGGKRIVTARSGYTAPK